MIDAGEGELAAMPPRHLLIRTGETIRVLNAAGVQVSTIPNPDPTASLGLSQDGQWLILATKDVFRTFRLP